jgi:AcrR family transcriptional regulator
VVSEERASSEKPASARARLIEAAQALFAQRGYNGVSVRDIATAAGVNSASIGYYFGGKENLLAEIYRISCEPMKAERRRLFAELDEAGSNDVQALVAAFVGPALSIDASGSFLRIRTLLSAENAEIFNELTAANFDETSLEFIARLERALPHLTREQVLWRYHFLLGTIYYSATGPQRIAALSGGSCDPRNSAVLLAHLLPFLTAGLLAP